MSFNNNIGSGSHIDPLHNYPQTPLPEAWFTPQPTTQQVPQGVPLRTSGDDGQPPRVNLGALSNEGAQLRKEATKAASDDGGDAMDRMIQMNNKSMEFQAITTILKQQNDMNNAAMKMVKDGASAVKQLAG